MSQALIDSSAVVFEGKIIKVDTIDIDGYDVDITFKVLQLFKGKPLKTLVVRSTRSSCGFYFQKKELHESIGKKYLMYCCLENGSYVYHSCSDRRLLFPLKKYFMNEYTQRSEVLSKYNKRKQDYERELLKLDSLTAKK
ncbi:MAG: hypothetical protein JNL24_03195 [Bacteroidia bacterium]|nr:hypothetical protein [Bacteroidia bacterium]